MDQFLTYNRYLKKRFGQPVLKIPINGGFSCPNRDGSLGSGGCIFCDNSAFSPAAETVGSVSVQLENGISRSPERFKKYIGYFQPYSNTYGPVEKLRNLYEPVINYPDVVGLALGTRPDCLKPEVYEYLHDVAGRTYLTVELGLQTVHDQTLRRINRCQTHHQGVEAMKELQKLAIETVAHIIIGLPGETRDMMLETAATLAALPVNGIKLHQLMVIKGTEMDRLYQNGEISVLSLEKYAQLATEFVKQLRPDQCIHRLMADSLSKEALVAPEWSREKGSAYIYIRDRVNRGLQAN